MNRTDIDRVLAEKLAVQSADCELPPELTQASQSASGVTCRRCAR